MNKEGFRSSFQVPSEEINDFPYGRVKKDSIKQGLMTKKGGKTRANWTERWFVLYYNCLLYFRPNKGKDKQPREDVKPSGIVLFKQIVGPVVYWTEKTYKHPCCVVPLPGRNFLFQADSEQELEDWMSAVQLQITKVRGAFLKNSSSPCFSYRPTPSLLQNRDWILLFTELINATVTNESKRQSHTIDGFLLDSRYYSSRLELTKILENVSLPDVWYDSNYNLKERVIHYQLFQLGTLLDRIKRPHEMLVLNPTIDIWQNPFFHIEDLLTEISKTKKNFTSLYPTVVTALTAIENYYLQWLQEAKTSPDFIVTPNLMVGHEIGCRQVSKEVVEKILGKRQNDFGLHAVTSYEGMHFKRDPAAPGFEFAVDCLNKLVSGQGSAPTQLIQVNGVPIQVSTTIEGVNMKTLLEKSPLLVEKINPDNYSSLFLLGLLTDLQDAKPENFVVRLHEDMVSLEIVGIDNDMAFAHPVCKAKGGKHFVNIRNIIYCLPQANRPISRKTAQWFLQQSPETVTMEWLRMLYKQNQLYDKLRQRSLGEGGSTPQDLLFSAEQLNNMAIPIKLRVGTAGTLYRKIIAIQHLLLKNIHITHNEILYKMQPTVYHYYHRILKLEPDPCNSFFRIFSGFFEEDFPDMDSIKIWNGNTLREEVEKTSDDHAFDFTRKRNQTVADAITEFLTGVNFSKLEEEVERDILNSICVSGISFRYFVLHGSKFFTDRMLQFLLDSSDTLQELVLTNCPNITNQGLMMVLYQKAQPIIRLKDCPKISQETIAHLSKHGVDIKTVFSSKELKENGNLSPRIIAEFGSYQFFKHLQEASPPSTPSPGTSPQTPSPIKPIHRNPSFKIFTALDRPSRPNSPPGSPLSICRNQTTSVSYSPKSPPGSPLSIRRNQSKPININSEKKF